MSVDGVCLGLFPPCKWSCFVQVGRGSIRSPERTRRYPYSVFLLSISLACKRQQDHSGLLVSSYFARATVRQRYLKNRCCPDICKLVGPVHPMSAAGQPANGARVLSRNWIVLFYPMLLPSFESARGARVSKNPPPAGVGAVFWVVSGRRMQNYLSISKC